LDKDLYGRADSTPINKTTGNLEEPVRIQKLQNSEKK
jgi:hypothetical protein